jgi:hypothetical protein
VQVAKGAKNPIVWLRYPLNVKENHVKTLRFPIQRHFHPDHVIYSKTAGVTYIFNLAAAVLNEKYNINVWKEPAQLLNNVARRIAEFER